MVEKKLTIISTDIVMFTNPSPSFYNYRTPSSRNSSSVVQGSRNCTIWPLLTSIYQSRIHLPWAQVPGFHAVSPQLQYYRNCNISKCIIIITIQIKFANIIFRRFISLLWDTITSQENCFCFCEYNTFSVIIIIIFMLSSKRKTQYKYVIDVVESSMFYYCTQYKVQ